MEVEEKLGMPERRQSATPSVDFILTLSHRPDQRRRFCRGHR